jgi:hypothetical protein
MKPKLLLGLALVLEFILTGCETETIEKNHLSVTNLNGDGRTETRTNLIAYNDRTVVGEKVVWNIPVGGKMLPGFASNYWSCWLVLYYPTNQLNQISERQIDSWQVCAWLMQQQPNSPKAISEPLHGRIESGEFDWRHKYRHYLAFDLTGDNGFAVKGGFDSWDTRQPVAVTPVLANTDEYNWGETVGGFQMATSVDESNAVIHCWIRNGLTNAITYNDFVFGYGENIGLEIRQGTEWSGVMADIFPGDFTARGASPTDEKVRWLQPGQIVTNTWERRDTMERMPYQKDNGIYYMRRTFLAGISVGDTFVLDLAQARLSTNGFQSGNKLQPGIYEVRVRQDFYSASPNDRYPYIHGPKLTLYSQIFALKYK